MAGTFRTSRASKEGRISAWASGVGEDAPLRPLTRNDLRSLTVEERLKYVAKAIMSYAHWYPGMSGLPVRRLQKGSAVCELDDSG